ncbi:MAG: outer membrane beta-barrel protein [Flavisolibacter sp.]|nr:outer membrane beta-barrel protein [Flavisolibacter sp.]
MQNEFEKQVQQKMEELKLVPSEPVWQKVEMQIRKKKGRRRLIFWIPVLTLLLGGGLWIGIDHYSNNVSYNRNETEKLNHQIPKQNSFVQPEQPATDQTIKQPQEKNLETTLSPRSGKTTSSITNESVRLSTTSAFQNSKQRVKPRKENSLPEQQEKSSAKNNETVLTETQTKTREPVLQQDQVNKQMDQEQNFSDSNLTTVSSGQKNDSLAGIEKVTLKVDSIKSDSIKQLRVKKYAASKWKLTFAVSGGVSGLGRLNVFNGFLIENKSMNYIPPVMSPGSGSGNGIYYPPSEVKKDFSFAVQAGINKQLTKRTSFSTGLGYNYYSNSILVGRRVDQNLIIRNYSVREYFMNSNSNYSNGTLEFYHNRYHFVTLPLALDWKLLKKHPLNLSTGISIQYLVQTNGLIFEYNNQAYFHNKNAFNRFQLFSGLGVNYSFPVKKNSIAIGPELQYGISRLEKGNSNHHLFMYGLKTQLQLK